MVDPDCYLLTRWGGDRTGNAEVTLPFETTKTEGVTMFDPLLLARAWPLLPPFVLATPETRRTAFFCFSAIMHANPSLETRHRDLRARYRNRYPDTRHMSAAIIVVISFASAIGSLVVEVYPRKMTRPKGTSNASRSCWRRASFELNSASDAWMCFFCYSVFSSNGRFTSCSPFSSEGPFSRLLLAGPPEQRSLCPRTFVSASAPRHAAFPS